MFGVTLKFNVVEKRLAISFSGGRTSAVMLKLCLDLFADTHDILITFANTGLEHPATLDFVDAVDRNFANGKVVWLEAVIHGPGKGPTAKVVTYETASRNGEPFEAAIKKHGIFCRKHPQCTSRLKTEPMLWFRKQHGWKPGTYDTAIGIRADEIDRQSAKAKQNRLVYPLISLGWTKEKVDSYMAQFPWDLKLPSDAYGNCVTCFKKSRRKLMTIAKQEPHFFEWPEKMEKQYGHIDKSRGKTQSEPRVMFRGRDSAGDVIEQSKTTDFVLFEDDPRVPFDSFLDKDDLCGGGCEVQ